MACGVCEAGRARKPLLCPDCFAASCAGRRSDQRALTEQRDALLQQLRALVAAKVRRRPGPPVPARLLLLACSGRDPHPRPCQCNDAG